MTRATKTLEAIDAAIASDQGARFRGFLGKVIGDAADAYRTDEDDFRSHLGASLIGRECGREIWYGFRWTTLPRFDGRILRLFNRGHLEEARFQAMLLTIGCQIWSADVNGKQFRISGHRGHFGGGIDGVALGVPDMPSVPMLTEFKTHNTKSFAKLVEEGVLKAKWEHYIQVQTYMGKLGLTHALYMAVNKDTDALYAEVIAFDPIHLQRTEMRAGMIIDATEAPKKISQSPGWFKCKFCDHAPVCHGDALPEVTCRSCVHVRVEDEGQWSCAQKGVILNKHQQRAACPDYVLNPTFKQ